jgi:hypothetical protein
LCRKSVNANYFTTSTPSAGMPQETRIGIYVGNVLRTEPITKRIAVYETRTYGGGRSAPHRFMRRGGLLDYGQPFLFKYTYLMCFNMIVVL